MDERLVFLAVILAILAVSISGAYEAREAHRYSHKLACALEIEDLCGYVKGGP